MFDVASELGADWRVNASLSDDKMLPMRTTINISESVYRDAKARAAQTSQTVSQVIEDAVREALRPRSTQLEEIKELPTFGGSGVLPGVDLANRSGLLDVMDAEGSLDAMR